jgi:hypothetical protein
MKPTLTLRIFYLAIVMLLASATAYAGNQQKKPKQRNESLSCSVNAPAGKQAQTRSTHIRKKRKARQSEKACGSKTGEAKTGKTETGKAGQTATPENGKNLKVENHFFQVEKLPQIQKFKPSPGKIRILIAMTRHSRFRLFFLAASFLLASFIPASAGNGAKKPKQRSGSLSCPVNASAGKRASTRPTHIRKKKSAKMKPAKKIWKSNAGQKKTRTAATQSGGQAKSRSSKPSQPKNRSLDGNQRGGGFSGGMGNDNKAPQQQRSAPSRAKH